MKNNIFIMYADFNYAYKFINYELPLTRGTETPMLVGTPANLNRVITTNTVHYEKFINKSSLVYKVLLPFNMDENIKKESISANLTGFMGWWGWSKNQRDLQRKVCKFDRSLPPHHYLKKSYNS